MEHKIVFFKPLILLHSISNWIRAVYIYVEMTIQTFLFSTYLSNMVWSGIPDPNAFYASF